LKRGVLLWAGLLAFGLVFSQGATNISLSPNTKSLSPRLTVDSRGNIHSVWGEQYSSADSGDVFYARFDWGSQQWSSPINLSNSGRVACDSGMTCALDVDGSDRVYVVWVEGSEVKLRTLSDGTWGGISQVQSGGGEVDTPRIAAGSEGNLYISWWTQAGYIYSRARVNGNWEGSQIISDTGRRSKFPDIAVGNGIVSAVWVEKAGDLYQAIYTQRGKGYGNGWSGRQSVSPSNLSQQHAVVELDASDTAHVIWTTVMNESGGRVVHHVFKSGGGFSSPQALSNEQVLHYPSLYKKGYNLYACWQLGSYGNGQGVSVNFARSGSWGGEAYVADSAGVTFCDIAANPDETAVYVVWDANNEIWINTAGGGGSSNKPPVANFMFTPTTGDYPLEVTFDASLSYDPDGRVAAYAWDFGDQSTGTGKTIKHTFRSASRFQVRLTVTDDKGKTGFIIKIVEVLKPNVPPTADFTISPGGGIFWKDTATFDGGLSSDSDGEVVSYEWDFGDDVKASGRVVSHYFKRWGVHQVQLLVTDNRNAVASKIKAIPILRLFQPLNIHWETHADEGLFLTRYVTDVFWERNPENDALGPIVKYRVWRKKASEPIIAFKPHYDLGADAFRYRDPDVGGLNNYTYTITAIDAKGHESPIEGFPNLGGPPAQGKAAAAPVKKPTSAYAASRIK